MPLRTIAVMKVNMDTIMMFLIRQKICIVMLQGAWMGLPCLLPLQVMITNVILFFEDSFGNTIVDKT